MISDPPETEVSEAPPASKTRAPDGPQGGSRAEGAAAGRGRRNADTTAPPPRRRRWLLVLAVIVAAVAAFLYFHNRGKAAAAQAGTDAKGGQGGQGSAGRPVPVLAAAAADQGRRRLPDRPRHGDAAEHGDRQEPRRRPAPADRLPRRADRPRGRPAGRDRSAPVPGAAHAGRGAAGEGRGGAQERPGRPRALPGALRRRTRSPSSSSTPRRRRSPRSQATLKSDQAQIESAKLNLTYSRITAPIAGRVGLRLVDAGNIVHATDANGPRRRSPSSSRSPCSSPSPRTSLPQVLPQMHGGQALAVDAYDRDLKQKLATGTLLTIDNQIDPTTGTVTPQGARSPTPTTRSSRTSSSTPGCWSTPCTAPSSSRPPPSSAARSRRSSTSSSRTTRSRSRNVTVGITEGDDAVIQSGVAAGDMRGHRRRRQAAAGHEGRRLDGGRTARPRGGRAAGQRRSGRRRQGPARPGRRVMSPSRPFILRPVATSLLMVGILLAGVVAYRQLPVSALPQVDYPTIQVVTFYPGASPDVMASSVTAPLERQFGQVPGLTQMTSTSSDGSSVITLQFDARPRTSTSPSRRCRRRSTPRGTLPAARPAHPADLQQDQPRRRADPDAGADLEDAAAVEGRGPAPTRAWRRRSRSCPASAWSASAAARSRRSASRPTRPRSPSLRPDPRGRAHRRRRRPTSTRPRATSTARASPTRSAPTTSCCRAPSTGRSSSPTATARRSASPTSPTSIDGAENVAAGGVDERRRRPSSSTSSASPGANIIAVVDRVKALLPQLQRVAAAVGRRRRS